MIKVAHAWSSALGINWSVAYDAAVEGRGWNVWHITPPPEASLADSNVPRNWLQFGMTRRWDVLGDLRGGRELARHFRQHRFDIVHTHAVKVGIVARIAAAITRTPIIVHTIHGLIYGSDSPATKQMAQAVLERIASVPADAVLVQSREDERILRESRAVPAQKLIWVGNGIDVSRFARQSDHSQRRARIRADLDLSEKDVLFLTAGRLVAEKGIRELLQAAMAARQIDSRIRLAIAGEIDHEKPDAISRELLVAGQARGVFVLGARSDMPDLIAAADVVALPSWREGLPRLLMEGAVMGKPLLATDVRGCREVVRHGENGLLVPVRDPAGLSRAMCLLAGDEGLRTRFGSVNTAEAPTLYDVHAVASRVLAVYDELIDRRQLIGHLRPTLHANRGSRQDRNEASLGMN